jgi:hypothetical protein
VHSIPARLSTAGPGGIASSTGRHARPRRGHHIRELGEQPGGGVPPQRQPGRDRRTGAAEFRRIAMMFNEAQVSLTGYVATEPRYRTVSSGTPVLSMRVGWTRRRRDYTTGEWSDGNTSFVTVTCWRKLAENLS